MSNEDYEEVFKDQLVYNAIRTPDGTVLVSRHHYDYVTYTDTIDNNIYMVDGGLDYLRRSVLGEDLSVAIGDGHTIVREVLEWGSFGISGKDPLKINKLKDMESDHIKAVLDNCHIQEWRRMVMKRELKERGEEYA
jgi:hypothetical protein